MHFIDELRWRGLLQDVSDEAGIRKLGAGEPVYVGFDPSAASLHFGNLVPLVTAIRLGKLGLKPILLFGGATGAIGDRLGGAPSAFFSIARQLTPMSNHKSLKLLQCLNVPGSHLNTSTITIGLKE